MDIIVKLECKLTNPAMVFQHQTALMAAFQLAHDFNVSKDMLIGTGPELYAEQWLRNFTNYTGTQFGNLIVIYFVKILWAQKHV